MQNRFHIEELVDQDESGVVFRAVDSETGTIVAVRRFFPFGAGGGGLNEEEQAAYQIAISRLASLRHRSLRAVIAGGCDEVDNIPFIVTEWVEGRPLREALDFQPLSAEHATMLVSEALEVSELLSQVLAEEAVWVETDPSTIIIGDDESGRGFTFWISPFRWLGGDQGQPPLAPVVTLVEEALHWKNRVISDQAGRGLGAWLKWLRSAQETAPLIEARQTLAAAVGIEPPPGPKALVAHATGKRPPLAQPSSGGIWWLVAVLAIATGGLGWWITQRGVSPPPGAAASADPERPAATPRPLPSPRDESGEARKAGSERRRQIDEFNASNAADLERATAALADQRAAVEKQGGVFFPTQEEALRERKKSTVQLEGVVERLDRSGEGKTIYLIFRENPGPTAPRGAVLLSRSPDLTEAGLSALIGKKVRITGTLSENRARGGGRRLEVAIDGASSIESRGE